LVLERSAPNAATAEIIRIKKCRVANRVSESKQRRPKTKLEFS